MASKQDLRLHQRSAAPQVRADGLAGPPPVRVPSRQRQQFAGSTAASPQGSPRAHKARWSRRSLLALQLVAVMALGLVATRQASQFRTSQHYGVGTPARKRQLIATAADDALLRQPSAQRQQQQQAGAPVAGVGPGGVSMFPAASPLSGVLAHPTSGPQGEPTTFLYRFTNVRLRRGAVEFFGGPGFVPPAEELWYDVGRGNSTSPRPPTTLVLQDGDAAAGGAVRHVPVQYLPQALREGSCRAWVEAPALLIHTRFPHNMWHTWAEGLVPAFQTLRELGYLPLMEVDAAGGAREVTEGVPAGECPLFWDPSAGAARPADECAQVAGLPGAPAACNLTDTATPWCLPGVWPHAAARAARPTLIYHSPGVVDNEWGSLYTAMAGGLAAAGEGAAEGVCLRNLVVGTSRTLSFSQAIPPGGEASGERGGGPGGGAAAVEALDVFARFARSALRRLSANNAIEFEGYAGEAAEKLRAGVWLGRGGLVTQAFEPGPEMVLRPTPAADRAWLDDWKDLQELPWVFASARTSLTHKSMRPAVAAEAAAAVSPPPGGPPPRRPADPAAPQRRPVVTYITRWPQYSRAVLNDAMVLRYILTRFNVTVRVTSLAEPAHAAAELLGDTDVLIGAHCEGWAAAAFLRPGAAALQLLPHGWRLPGGGLLRGGGVRTLVHMRQGAHLAWVNPHPEFSFFRREDFLQGEQPFRPHPDAAPEGAEDAEDGGGDSGWAAPRGAWPHPAWLNANTYADLNHLGPYIEEIMAQAGIPALTAADLERYNAERAAAKARYEELKAERAARAAEREAARNDAAAGGSLEEDGEEVEA